MLELGVGEGMEIPVLITKKSNTPVKTTSGAAAYDLRATRNIELLPGSITKVDLNLQIAIPKGFYLQLASRSGLVLKNIVIVGGVIDGDYTGPVAALVLNLNKETFRVSKGQRIAQGLFLPVCSVQFKNVDQLPSTDQGDAGFGSTDQNH